MRTCYILVLFPICLAYDTTPCDSRRESIEMALGHTDSEVSVDTRKIPQNTLCANGTYKNFVITSNPFPPYLSSYTEYERFSSRPLPSPLALSRVCLTRKHRPSQYDSSHVNDIQKVEGWKVAGFPSSPCIRVRILLISVAE